jgi:hypothetical protein
MFLFALASLALDPRLMSEQLDVTDCMAAVLDRAAVPTLTVSCKMVAGFAGA